MFVKTGDKVKVIAGNDKGKEGIVLSVNAKTNRVVVKGIHKVCLLYTSPSPRDRG